MSIDNKKIEETGVNFVRSAFNAVPRVLTHLDIDDKTIFIDGTIDVYCADQMKKETLFGIIHVQVKSTRSKPGKTGHPKYRLDIVDLEKYRDVYGGIILFVAYLRPDLTLRYIFYKTLLPYDIHMILKDAEGEGTKSVALRLDPLPNDPKALYRLCQEYLVDARKQAPAAAIGVKSYDDWRIEGVSFDAVELSKVYVRGESPIGLSAFQNGAYVYGTLDSGIKVPIGKIENPTSISVFGVSMVKTGEFKGLVNATFGEDGEGEFIAFPGFELRRGDSVSSIKYRDKGSYSERYTAARIILGLLETGELSIDGVALRSTGEVTSEDLEDARCRVGFYQEIEDLRCLLNIKVDWDPDQLSDSDAFQIEILIRGFVYKERVRLTCSQDPVVNLNCDVGGTRIKVIAVQGEGGEYELHDPLSPNIMLVLGNTEEELESNVSSPVPPLFIMNKEDFQMAGNLDKEKFGQALARFPIVNGNSSEACNKLLVMLSAFDENPICPNELIGCAQLLSEALSKLEPGNERYTINRLQCIKRIRPLTPEEESEAQGLLLFSEDAQVRVAASAILGKEGATDLLLSKLDEEEKKAYLSWPISNLAPLFSEQ